MGSHGPRAGWRVALAAGAMALSVAACAARIWRDEATPQGVRLHWYTNEASIDDAKAEAGRYCQGWNKRAELLEEFIDDDVTVARFGCR
jgi:hypothetical protein